MSDKQMMHHDPLTGITDYFVMGEDGKSFTMLYEQDASRVNEILDFNKSEQNMQTKTDRWGDGKIVATIPPVIYADWLAKGYMQDQKKLKALLNDPDHKWMRRWQGVL